MHNAGILASNHALFLHRVVKLQPWDGSSAHDRHRAAFGSSSPETVFYFHSSWVLSILNDYHSIGLCGLVSPKWKPSQ